ncbi:SNF2 helicase with zinc finger RING-type domain [Fadolivirus algeromassiliense]|jgi:SNF2 family DNA or RNA helicase|uniref:SNF2 helicase with zinc finger RING-type domain n=1 Tax=Fadolivirus FV1/VV64 TaxID=3070911 RepID=A0A7D3QV74_9VIRU|nr:SNF2 helicase with zinc finger RING-type domain [Fadolivirus algeromassiliense]QKF94044.1 SNF2 helicase with zinc finger RING-type domain [Fadolivirus FV1/VV64]
MWCNLFYDKYAGDISGHGDHHFNNQITSKVSINDLEDGSYEYYSGKQAVELYNNKFKNIGHFSLEDCVYKSDLYKLMIYTKNVNGMETIYVVVGVNTKLLEDYVVSKTEIPSIDFLKNLCTFHSAYTETTKFLTNSYYYNNNSLQAKVDQNISYICENAIKAVDYTFDNKVNKFDELEIDLFEYQKCSIYWMVQQEMNKKKISYNLNDEVVLGNVYYDMITHTFNLLSDKKTLTFNGGGIIDEVGLGKTLQVIGLGLSNPAQSISYTRDDQPHKFVSKATLIFCPNQLCGQWNRELKDRIKKDADVKLISLMTKRDFDKYTYNDLLDADFVVVSYTFLDNKCFTGLWTPKVSTYKNYYKQEWNQVDLQLIEKVFDNMGTELVNDPINSLYKINPLIQLIHWNRFVVDEFHEIYKDDHSYRYISNLIKFITADYKWCVTATPFNQKRCLTKIVDFLTNYNNTDGDKIYTVEQIVDYLSFECFRRNTKDSVKQEHTLPPIKEEIRWLKFSPTERAIYNAYLANPNNDRFSVYLRQLCCHPQLADETKEALSNCKTLEDIEKMMVNHYKTEMDEAQQKVNGIQERIDKINKKIKKIEKKQKKRQLKKLGYKVEKTESDSDDSDDDDDDDNDDDILLALVGVNSLDDITIKPSMTVENLKDTIKTLEVKLKEANGVLDGKKSTYNFFNNVVDKIKKTVNKESDDKKKADKFNPALDPDTNIMNILAKQTDDDDNNDDEVCGICLGEILEDDIGVTKCGHIFCFECLRLTVSKYHNCPYCKKNLTEKEIYVLSYERKKKDKPISQEEKNKAELINEIGTKLANLITYLRESGEHTIIFSQWDDLLRRVGRILKENGIQNVFCKGNCYQRDKAIREFNSDDKIKVIMLSSDSTAAGTNLTKASQVVFIDPIYGDYKYRKDQEKQAIGRAHRLGQKSNIKVVRFIIKDSVEEEIYRKNVEEDKKHISEFASSNEIIIG